MTRITIPDRLYGRDRSLAELLESLERVSKGQGEILLVPGSSGVGKTALVEELRLPSRDINGSFVEGKFDQYQQNVPYSAFRQALAALCRELQTAERSYGSRLKAELLQSVGTLGQVLVDLDPVFELFLGPQPPMEIISPQEARHRFAEVCRSFLKVVCRPEHPLVLFIDDWQWADAASCELLKQIQVGITLPYLLVVVAFRDDEMGPDHPFVAAMDDLRSNSVPLCTLHVEDINADDVRALITDTLKPAVDDLDELAAIIHGKTHGNPFFARSFLVDLHDLGFIRFDEERRRWSWRIGGGDESGLPVDVVELFVMKMRRLDSEVWNLLSLAACLGNRFDVSTLSIISGRDPEECLALLSPAAEENLVRPADDPTTDPGSSDVWVFLHDRVQQAAFTMIETSERPRILLEIGRLLLDSLSPERLTERLFEVVGDLNAGRHLIVDTAEQIRLLELNVQAARKAFTATAYGAALRFFREASSFVGWNGLAEQLWIDRYDLMMQLLRERAECEFLEGDRHQGEVCVHEAVARASTPVEAAAALKILIVHYTLTARYPEAIAAGRQGLAALGIELPEADYENARQLEIEKVRGKLLDRPISSLAELPVMSDPEKLMAADLLITMGPPCYRSHQRLWGVLVPTVVDLTLDFGNIPQVGYSHTAFGGLLGWVDGDFTSAKELGDVATRLMTSTFQAPSHQSVFYLMIGSSIRHWCEHLSRASQDYRDAYEIGLHSGNLQYAAYAFGHNMYCQFYQGASLEKLIRETEHSLAFGRTRVNQWAIDLFTGGLRIFEELTGHASESLPDGDRSDDRYLSQVAGHDNVQVTCIYKVLKTCSLLVRGDLEKALQVSDEAEPLIFTVGTQGLLPWPEHVFARFLILSGLIGDADDEQRAVWRRELDLLFAKLRLWADTCPENFEHKVLLAEAEITRIDGRTLKAVELYDEAIAAASKGGFVQWEGVASERACTALLEDENPLLAQVYWQHAYAAFDRWGAVSKTRSMEIAYHASLVAALDGTRRLAPTDCEEDRRRKDLLAERQVERLREYSEQMQQSAKRIRATTQAEELTRAMDRVRVEIAERKRTEEALRDSESLLMESQTIARLGSFVLDVATGSWSSSAALDELFGIDAEYERSVDGWAALMHPDDRAMMVAYLRDRVIGGGESFDKEYRIIRLDNRMELWVHGLGRLDLDDRGRPRSMRGTIQDITERKRAEFQRDQLIEELQEALGRVKSLSGLLPICAGCKKIRDDQGYWTQVESYIQSHSEASFSHGMCPECAKKWWPELE